MYPISFNFEIENARCNIFLSVKMREKNAGQIAIQWILLCEFFV